MKAEITPLVSVCMITYKHEKYIQQAIDGVLKQEVDFHYELIIANDNSPDNTEKIVQKIIENNPKGGLIKYIRHIENVGAIPNFYFSFTQARGKYIAICEGDDFWTDSNKLQLQIDFLQTHPDYDASFHDVSMLFNNKEVSFSENRGNIIGETIYFDDVVSNDWIIPTCSFVFRKNKMNLPPFYKRLTYGDFPLFCCILINSKAYYSKEIMAVYRRNNSESLTNTVRTFGFLSVSTDYIQLLTWLFKYANDKDQISIENRIYQEIDTIRRQTEIYKKARMIKIYSFIRKYFSSSD